MGLNETMTALADPVRRDILQIASLAISFW